LTGPSARFFCPLTPFLRVSPEAAPTDLGEFLFSPPPHSSIPYLSDKREGGHLERPPLPLGGLFRFHPALGFPYQSSFPQLDPRGEKKVLLFCQLEPFIAGTGSEAVSHPLITTARVTLTTASAKANSIEQEASMSGSRCDTAGCKPDDFPKGFSIAGIPWTFLGRPIAGYSSCSDPFFFPPSFLRMLVHGTLIVFSSESYPGWSILPSRPPLPPITISLLFIAIQRLFSFSPLPLPTYTSNFKKFFPSAHVFRLTCFVLSFPYPPPSQFRAPSQKPFCHRAVGFPNRRSR